MNCRDALRLLYDVVDKEAAQIDSAEVEKHLNKCRHCLAKYEFEQMFKTFVTDKGSHPGEHDNLKQRILSQLDSIDAAGEVGAPPRPFKRRAVLMLAAAALLIIAVVGAFRIGDYVRTQREFVPFAVAHFAHEDESEEASEEHSPQTAPFDYLFANTGIRLNPTSFLSSEMIASVSIDTIKGVPFGRLEIGVAGRSCVSLFVARTEDYEMPTQPVETIDGHRVIVHRCDGCNLIGFSKDNLVFMVVSKGDHDCSELTRFAAAF